MLCYGRDVSAPRTARARVRAQLTEEILGAAHEEMVEHGAAGLSLRAVARRLEMVPSAVYRYFPSRDALLTALIVDAYVALADAAGGVDLASHPGGIVASCDRCDIRSISRWTGAAIIVRVPPRTRTSIATRPSCSSRPMPCSSAGSPTR